MTAKIGATLAFLVALAFVAPGPATGQPVAIHRVGLFFAFPTIRHEPIRDHPDFVALEQRLRALGYAEGQNLVFVTRGGPEEQLPELAAELVKLNVDIIVGWANAPVLALKRRTTTIPIVMASSGDAVGVGLVASLARPGGNVTGLTFQSADLVGKKIQFIREFVPAASRIGILWDPKGPMAPILRGALEELSRTTKLSFEMADAVTEAELDKAFRAMRQARVDGVVVFPAPRYFHRPAEVAHAAMTQRLLTVFGDARSVEAGGLMAYMVEWTDMSRRAADYVDRILKGTKPADLPVEQPTKYRLLINVRTASVLGLTVPPSLRLRADRVIE